MTDLDIPGPLTRVNGINTSGQVAGSYYASDNYDHAFITGPNGANMTDLGTLSGYWSGANAINASGQVAGHVGTSNGGDHAFITGPNGVGMTDLGTLGEPWFNSYGIGINDAGQVVGYSDASIDGSTHAFIIGPNGMGMTDLNSLIHLPTGVVLTDAVGINNMGQVIALGTVGLVPELESYALMLAGLALIGAMVRCKQKG